MDAAARQLEHVNQAVADVTAKTDFAWDSYMSNIYPGLQADWLRKWQQLVNSKEDLLTERRALAAFLRAQVCLMFGRLSNAQYSAAKPIV
jgi:hypothetical protein